MPKRLLHLVTLIILISVFSTEVKASRDKFNPQNYLKLLKEEQVYTSKRKQVIVRLNKEYIKKFHYYCKQSKKDRCQLYDEKIKTTQEVFELLTGHQEDILTEIDEQF